MPCTRSEQTSPYGGFRCTASQVNLVQQKIAGGPSWVAYNIMSLECHQRETLQAKLPSIQRLNGVIFSFLFLHGDRCGAIQQRLQTVLECVGCKLGLLRDSKVQLSLKTFDT